MLADATGDTPCIAPPRPDNYTAPAFAGVTKVPSSRHPGEGRGRHVS